MFEHPILSAKPALHYQKPRPATSPSCCGGPFPSLRSCRLRLDKARVRSGRAGNRPPACIHKPTVTTEAIVVPKEPFFFLVKIVYAISHHIASTFFFLWNWATLGLPASKTSRFHPFPYIFKDHLDHRTFGAINHRWRVFILKPKYGIVQQVDALASRKSRTQTSDNWLARLKRTCWRKQMLGPKS